MKTNSDYLKAKGNLSERCGVGPRIKVKASQSSTEREQNRETRNTARIMTMEESAQGPMWPHYTSTMAGPGQGMLPALASLPLGPGRHSHASKTNSRMPSPSLHHCIRARVQGKTRLPERRVSGNRLP